MFSFLVSENLPFGIKLGTKTRVHRFDIIDISRNIIFVNFSPNWRPSNTDTPHDITTSHIPTCSFWSCARAYSVTLGNHLCVSQRKKCPGIVSQADIHRNCIRLQNMDISFFSFPLYILVYTRYDCDIEPTYSFWEDLMFRLSFSKSVLNYAPNTVASYSFIFTSMLFQ